MKLRDLMNRPFGSSDELAEASSPAWIESSSEHEAGAGVTRPLDSAPARVAGDSELPELPASPAKKTRWIGPYLLIERLGGGGQGSVWKALQTEPVVDLVALKILSPLFGQDPRRVAQLRHEGERAARLSGPSILPVYEFGAASGYVFLAMPFIEGCTLAEVIRRRRLWLKGRPLVECHLLSIMPEHEYLEEVLRLGIRLAGAVADAHRMRVVHRDIKPSNVILGKRSADQAYLCDFGLGRDLDIATSAQMRDGAGTPVYMAPERLLKGDTNEELSDIFSLGATLFEALTLEKPYRFPEDMPRAMWASWRVKTATPRLSDARPFLPHDLEATVARAMESDPTCRHASARELQFDLETRLASFLGRQRANRLPRWVTMPKTERSSA